jgi:IS5 family transposase
MSQPRDDRQDDLFRPPLKEIINLRHSLVRLAEEIDWDFLAGRFSSVCRVGPGQPPLPTRLVAGLLMLKHMHNLSDEALCERWVENPYFQYFCGEVVFRHELPFDRDQRSRTGCDRYHCAGEGDRPSDRRPAHPPRDREAGGAGQARGR